MLDEPPKASHFDVMVRARLIKFRTLISNSDTEKGFSIKSTLLGGNSLKLDTSRLVHQALGVPEMKRTGRLGNHVTSFNAISVPEERGRSISVTNRDIDPHVFPISSACKPVDASRTE